MKKRLILLTLCSLTFSSILTSCNDDSSTQEVSDIKITTELDSSLGNVTYDKKAYKIGDTIVFKFAPKEGYAVSTFKVNKKIIRVNNNEATFIIDSNELLLEVSFVEISNITINYDKEGGDINYAKVPYKIGDKLHLKVTPKDGYYLAYVKRGKDRIRPTKGEYLIDIDAKNIAIDISFVKVELNMEDITFNFDEDNKTATIVKYSPYNDRIPYPFIVPETVIKNNVTYKIVGLEEKSFVSSSIKAIHISKNITSIAPKFFAELYGLKEVVVDKENTTFASKDNILYSKDFKKILGVPTELQTTNIVIDPRVETISQFAFLNNRLVTSIKMGDHVKTLEKGAFAYMKSLSEIELSPELLTIPEECFDNNINLKGITIPSKVTSIETHAFNFCSSFTYVNFPDSLRTIGLEAFNHCQKLSNLVFNEGLETIGKSAFGQVEGITSIEFPSSLKEIGDAAFEVCANLVDVKFNEGLKILGGAVFAMCPELGDIVLPASLETVNYNPFYGNARTTLKVKEGSKFLKVKDGVLYDINETRLISFPRTVNPEGRKYIIPNTVTEICENAFSTNMILEELTIPVSVTKMYLAFENIFPTVGHKGAYYLAIFYEGTKAQFNAIDHGSIEWNYKANFRGNVLTCNDGEIPLRQYM